MQCQPCVEIYRNIKNGHCQEQDMEYLARFLLRTDESVLEEFFDDKIYPTHVSDVKATLRYFIDLNVTDEEIVSLDPDEDYFFYSRDFPEVILYLFIIQGIKSHSNFNIDMFSKILNCQLNEIQDISRIDQLNYFIDEVTHPEYDYLDMIRKTQVL
jgi:hypothetical protein